MKQEIVKLLARIESNKMEAKANISKNGINLIESNKIEAKARY